jgi:hypothetical protein
MTPINTKLTAMDEVIVLRKAKRLASNVRASFSTNVGRTKSRETYGEFLDEHPLSVDGFRRFVWHLNECFPSEEHDAQDVILHRGYF